MSALFAFCLLLSAFCLLPSVLSSSPFALSAVTANEEIRWPDAFTRIFGHRLIPAKSVAATPLSAPEPVPFATTYTYSRAASNTSGTADQWSAGTNWSATPVSATDATLTFNATVAAGVTIFTNNDNAGDFKHNIFNFTYVGPASGTQPTVTVSGNRLEFISNGATTPTMSIASTGTIKPLLAISSNALLTNDLSVSTTTDAVLSGTISGSGSLTKKTSSGTLTLSGANTHSGGTFWGSNNGTAASGGTIILGTSSLGGPGSITSGPFGTATFTVENSGAASTSFIQSSDGTSRTISNAIAFAESGILFNFGGTGDLILDGTVNLGSGGRTFTVGNTNTTFSGVISSTSTGGTLTKAGTGTLILSGTNTYTGTTTINAGTLSINTIKNTSTNSALGAPTTTANGTIGIGTTTTGATLKYTGTGDTTDRVINLAGTTGGAIIDQSGTGLFKFTGANTATGNGVKTLTLQGSTAGTGEIGGAIVDSTSATSLTKSGTGTWTLSGANTFTGGVTLSNGTLNINHLTALGTGTFTISGLTIDNTSGAAIGPFTNNNAQTWNGDFNFTGGAGTTHDLNFGTGAISLGTQLGTQRTITTSAGTLTFGGVISNGTTANGLTKFGAGTLALSGANTYSGGTTLGAGSIILGNKAALGSGTIAFNGVTTSASTDLQGANAVTNNGTFGATGNVFSGANGITFTGTFTNSVTSNTITNGITFLTFNGPFNLSDAVTSRTVTIDGGGATVIGGVIANGGGSTSNLAKSGAGNLGLSAVNTYSGTTTINAGTLALSSNGTIANTSSITIKGGARLDLSGMNTALTLASGQTLSFPGETISGTALIGVTATRGLTTFGNNPLNFTAFDGLTPPVKVSGAGAINLAAGDQVTVTTTSALGVGNYTLISNGVDGGSVAGTAPTLVAVNGSGLAAGTVASLQISGSQLVLHVASSLFYRSVASGNWNANSTWESSANNSTWAAATSTPTSADQTITIRSPNTVTVTASVDADQLTVDSGGTLTINSGVTFTVADGTGTDATVNGSLTTANGVTNNGQVTVNGTLTLTSGSFTNANNLTMGTGSNISRTSAGTLSAAPIFSGTVNVTYTGSTTVGTGPELPTSTTALNNFTANMTGGGVGLGSAITVNGTFSLTSTVSADFGTSQPMTFKGDWSNTNFVYTTLAATTFAGTSHLSANTANNQFASVTIASGGSVISTITMRVSGDWTDNATTGGASGNSGGSEQFNGTGTQTVGGSVTRPNFSYIQLNCSGTVAAAKGLSTNILQLSAGTFDDGGFTHNVGTDFLKSSGVYLASGTINFNGTGVNIDGSNFNNLTMNLTSAGAVAKLFGNVTIAGNWTNTQGTLNPNGKTVTFNGSGNTQTISGTNAFYWLLINHTGGGGVTAAGSTLSVTGLLGVTSGTFTSASDYESVQIDPTGTLALSGPITVSLNWVNNGTFTPNGFGVTFDGTGAQTITTFGAGAGKQFAGITVSNSSGGVTVVGDLAMGSTSPLGLSHASGTPTVSQTGGAFALAAGNPVTVTTTSALGAGDYILVSAGSGGSVTGTAPTSLTMAGSGLAAGMAASLQITGSQLVLHVAAVPPTVTTNAANPVGSTTATLNGSANPNSAATVGWFRYATTNPGTCNDAFGTRAPATGGSSLGSGATAVAYTQGITGLSAGQTYYFCAIASNAGGTAFGAVLSFTTPTIITTGTLTDFGSVTVGNYSPAQSYSVSASGLSANLTVTAPTGFEVSQSQFTGFANTFDLVPSSGTVSSTTIWVRFAPASAVAYNDNVTNASSGATTQNVAVTGTGVAAACTAPPSGMALWMPFNSGTTQTDISGNGNHGTTVNGAVFNASGKVGGAMFFDGVNDFVNVPTSATLDPTTTASLDAWVYFNQTPSAAGRYMAIMSKGSGSPGGDFDLLASPTDNKFYFYAGNGFNVASTTVIQTGVWYHVAATWDAAASMKMYVNGVLENTAGGGGSRGTSSVPFEIGSSFAFSDRVFSGLIDEAEVFNRALDGTEVAAIYNASTAGKCVPPLTVSSTNPTDGATGVAVNSTVSVTFSPAADPTTITAQATTGSCSGSLQVSSDNFATCIGLGTPAASGGNTIFTSTPSAALSNSTTYKIRVTTAAKTAAGAPLASTFTQATGFTTAAAPETTVAVTGGNLVITDGNGGNTDDTLTISRNGANIRVNDPSHTLSCPAPGTPFDANTCDVPFTSITGNIQVNTLGGNDLLTLNFAGGNLLPPGGLSYDGGSQTSTPGDKLAIAGGSQGTVTYNYTNGTPGAGNIVMSAYGTVSYTGLEPISNSGTATDVIFNLPAGPNAATLADDAGGSGNGLSTLSAATFEATTFSNPSGSLTINRGNAADTLSVDALPDFNASLTIGSVGNEFSSILFNGAVSLAANKNLSGDASSTISLPSTTSDLATIGTGTITLTTARDISLGSGSSITTVNGNLIVNANQQVVPTSGNFSGVNVNGALIQATGIGAVTVKGKGGDSGGGKFGVLIQGGGNIIGGTSGLLTVQGSGGASPSGGSNFGVLLDGASTTITSSGANVSVTGTGGGADSNGSNGGVGVLNAGQITAGVSGTVTVVGNGGNLTGTGGSNSGVWVGGTSSTITSSGGNVSVTGTGGGADISTDNYGVFVNSTGQITAGGSGTVTVVGNGGNLTGTGSLNYGVFVAGASATIKSSGGNVSVTGTGGGAVSSTDNYGVFVLSAGQITAGGSGTVTVVGNGGNLTGTGSRNYGVYVDATSSTITSSGGSVSVTGTGGGAGSSFNNYGVLVQSAGQITAGGSGTVTVVGNGGNLAGTGSSNYGVLVDDTSSTITSNGGNVSVTGTEGGNASPAINVTNPGTITTATNGGTLTLIGNSMNFAATSTISAQAGSSVTLRQRTTGVAIDLGAATDPNGGPLSLTDAELDRVTAGTINIGDSNSGAITVSTAITRSASTNLNLTSGGAINLNASSLGSGGGNVNLHPGSGAAVHPAANLADVSMSTTGTLSFASDLAIAITGTTVDTQYQQLNVVGKIDLTGVNLLFTGSTYAPVGGEIFTIVNNDQSDAITGTFAGLAEGATIPNFLGSSLSATITYVGGTNGNDVLLTVASPAAPTLGNYGGTSVALSGDTTVTPDASPTNTTSINVSTSTSFNGKLTADAGSGVVRVTNAQPAGTYTVTVKAFGPGGSTTKTFTLTVNTGTACTGTPGFTNAEIGVGSNPASVAIGDFNNDGNQDLAVANSGSSNVSILLGNGSGGFSSAADVSVGSSPTSVAVGDFNNDGKQDLAVTYASSSSISIRLGDGLGGFTNAADVAVGSNQTSIAVGDFNNDGNQDFAVTHNMSTIVSIRLGNGSGGFTNATDVTVGTSPASVVVGDFNNDSNQDFATANVGSATVSIRLGNGSGGFSAAADVGVGSSPASLAIGHFNNDSNQDLAVANSGSTTVSIRLGNGSGAFSAAADVNVGSSPASVAIGDFNNDSNQDLAVVNSNTVSLRLGDGSGVFTAGADVGVGAQPQAVAVGDFSNDGKQDFATPNLGSGQVSVRLGGCTPVVNLLVDTNSGTEAAPTVVTVTATASDPVVGDQTLSLGVSGTNITAGDYTLSNSTITILNGQTTGSVTFTVVDDSLYEGPETATLTISSPSSGIALGTTTTQDVTITDNETEPTISIDNVSLSESGGTMIFTVTQSAVSGLSTTFQFSTTDVSATAGQDYTGTTNNPRTIPAGSTTALIGIPILPDAIFEGDETFTVTLGAPVNATINTGTGTGTITDDNSAPTFSIDNVTLPEGNGPGTTAFTFTVTKSGATALPSSVDVATADGTGLHPATAGSDYTAIPPTPPTTLHFLPSETTQTVTVYVNGDTDPESDETFFVNLSNVTNGPIVRPEGAKSATMARRSNLVNPIIATGTGTITDDDSTPTPDVSVAVSTPSVFEDGVTNLDYTFTRTGDTTNPLTVNFVVSGTADPTPGTDYTVFSATDPSTFNNPNGTVIITAGNASATVTFDPTADADYEANETAIVTVTAGSGYNVGSPASATGTITNDDTTLIVTKTADTDNTCLPGDCSLREAIKAANSDPDANTITFDIAGPGPHTIQLILALDNLAENVNINGPADESVTVRGEGPSNPYRIFTINSGKTVSISNLNITNGAPPSDCGGGIKNDHGTLTVTNSTIYGNAAGQGAGICNFGGGGPTATLTVINSTISGNTAIGQGGGISNQGQNSGSSAVLTVVNSTLAGNTATSGAGVFNYGFSGGNGIFNVRNTIFANGANGGNLDSATGSGGSGGIFSQGHNLSDDAAGGDGATVPGGFLSATGDIRNTNPQLAPLANNGGPTLTQALLGGSPAIDAGDDCVLTVCTPPYGFSLTTDQRGAGYPRKFGSAVDIGAFELEASCSAVTLSPGTLPNGTNGVIYSQAITASPSGTYTFTVASGSLPTDLILATDGTLSGTPSVNGTYNFQVLATEGNGCMGLQAYTIVISTPPTSLVVTKTADTDDHDCSLTDCSLREAIEAANSNADTNTITFDIPLLTDPGCGGSGPCTISLTTGTELAPNSDMNINGPTGYGVVVAGSGTSRVFNVQSGTISISNLMITLGVDGQGGGIFNQSTLTLTSVIVKNNSSGGYGGGIGNTGNLTLTNCTVDSNQANGGGGGGINSEGPLTVISSTISGNFASAAGGGIRNLDALFMTNSTVSGNSANRNSGGVHNDYSDGSTDPTALITNCTITNNTADADDNGSGLGGGLLNNIGGGPGAVTLQNTIIAGNRLGSGAADDLSGDEIDTGNCSNNLIGFGGSGGLTDGVDGNRVGFDPRLGPLQNNGGPTFTHALLPASPAIDAGHECVLDDTCSLTVGFNVTTDQRGITRPQGARVDIGAFELQAYVVNHTADTDDGFCTALGTGPGNQDCTLREAINAANADAPSPRLIDFDIPGTDTGCTSGVCTIAPLTNLPALVNAIFINGYSQTGATPNTNTLSDPSGDNAAIMIVLDGAAVTTNPRGFDLESGSDNSAIRGFVISRWDQAGVWIQNGGGNVISGNFIGTDVTGLLSSQGGGGNGVTITQGLGTVIGGDIPETRNVIAGYAGAGINISGVSSTFNSIEGNYIGTNRIGSGALGNSTGVSIQAGASNNTVGCEVLDGDNVISGNTSTGIGLNNTSGNFIQGNFIGTDQTGSSPVPNGKGIIVLDAPNNTIGVINIFGNFGNVISGNGGDGILIQNSLSPINPSQQNTVQGNFIGTNPLGTAALPNTGDGVKLDGASSNAIGGTLAGQGNVISGNGGEGIEMVGGASFNTVQGNFIGTDVNGAVQPLMGNTGSGVEIYVVSVISPSSNNTIGGSSNSLPSERARLAGKTQSVPAKAAAAPSANQSAARKTSATHAAMVAARLKRAGGKRSIRSIPSIGNLSAANIIAGNGEDGVRVTNTGDVSNAILGNSIYLNQLRGIDLGGDGVTGNDVGDSDPGPNNLQNFPVIQVAAVDTQTVSGTLDSPGGGPFTIELFNNGTGGCDGTNGEGKTLIASFTQPGDGPFSALLPANSFAFGEVITATATDVNNNTSEFSVCFTATASANANPTITATTGLSRQQGSPASNSIIATVDDADTGPNSVTVSVTSLNPSNGVTISNIQNANDGSGHITADIIAACGAIDPATFTLQASDGSGGTATANLSVAVTPNDPPTLIYPTPPAVTEGNSLTVTPTTATDNGSPTGYAVQSVVPPLTTPPTVDSNGVVSITNAEPAGSHVITIQATDNCTTTTDAQFTLTVNAATCTPPPPDMVAWLPGDGNADDVTGNGNNGTLNGGATFAPGKVDQAFSLNGTDAYVSVPDAASLRPASVSVDGWFKLNATPVSDGMIVAKALGSTVLNSYVVYIGGNGGAITANVCSSTPACTLVGSGVVPQVGVWYHYAMTYDDASQTLKLYVDGTERGSQVSAGTVNIGYDTNPVFIGADFDNGGATAFFPGLIDETEIFINRALSPTEVGNIYNASFAGKCRTCTTPPNGMVSWWPAETNANDIAGPNSGTFAANTYAPGKVGQAFSFDGVDDFVSIPAFPATSFQSGTTLDLWFNSASFTGPFRDIVSTYNAPGGPGWTLYFQGTLRFYDGVGDVLVSSVVPQTNQWYHVAVVRSGDTYTMYLNGNVVSTGVSAYNNIAAPMRFSGRSDGTGLYSGLIDEVEVFNRVLSQTEIRAIVDAGNAGKCRTSTIQFAQANKDSAEGDSGSHTVDIPVTRNGDLTGSADVTYTVTDGTAQTADGDYSISPATGTLHWNNGDGTPKNITVTVFGDTTSEADETVNLTLSNAVTASLGTPNPATLTITNDDPAPTVTIGNRTANEGSPSGTTAFTFTVTRTGSTGLASTVSFATADDTGGANPATGGGSCVPGVDYIPQSGIVSFPASGAGSTSQPITIQVCRDSVYEANETFLVNLSTPTTNATLGSPSQGVGTITNDDAPAGGFVVNTTNDVDDGVCNAAHCSLREAINAANTSGSAVSITFAIPAGDLRHFYYTDDGAGSPNGTVTLANVATTTAANDAALPANKDPDWPHGWWSILPTGPLPTVTQTVVIDGYTQTVEATANTLSTSDNAVLEIELDGASAGAGSTGLRIAGGGSILRGVVINRFGSHGVNLQSTPGSTVTGNFIGTDVSGTLGVGLSNAGSGVSCASNSMAIGGSSPALVNLISGNGGDGILLTGSNSDLILGNFIGTKSNGTSALPNGASGINITGGGSVFNTIGGINAGEANTIGFNTRDGVRLADSGVGNAIRGNSIFSNGSAASDLGIDLGADGVTPNDNKDPDSGPNTLQNFPVITTAVVTGTTNTIAGTLNSTVGGSFTIDFYQNTSCDTAGGNGEGKTYIGSTTVTTDGVTGNGSFVFHPLVLTVGQVVTATATSDVGVNTSEFSSCFTVVANSCPTTFTVNSNLDTSDAIQGDGVCATAGAVCTLRAAIEEANALAGCGTINIDFSGVVSPINLGTALPAIDHNVNINGPGANLLTVQRNSGSNFRIFAINSGRTVGISGLTISNGSQTSGGGIYNGGTLTLTGSTVSGNTASGPGGGIFNDNATLTLTNSTVSGNTASGTGAQGGGIYGAFGTLTLTNSTVSGNTASGTGAQGGGIYRSFGTLTLTNSTVSGNTASGAGAVGGGVYNDSGTANARNTIIAGNTASTSGPDINGTFISQSNNLIGKSDGGSGFLNGSNGDQVGTIASPIDPLLGALMNNGGPTFTHGLLYNSPAVDAGNDCVFNNTCAPPLGVSLTLDQRGLLRKADGDLVSGAHVDIGAYERQASESRPVGSGSNIHVDLNDVRLFFPTVSGTRRDDGAANGVAPDFNVNNSVSITVIPVPVDAPPSSGPAFNVTPSSAFYTPPVDVCFYLPSITNPATFSTLKVLHREGGVLTDHGEVINFATKMVCTEVTSFSDFVITHGTFPSAATGSIDGKITDSNGTPVAGATINLSGTQSRETITDAAGNYSFDGVEANGFYTVTPSRANYTFNPANRSFSALGAHTEALFTASANGDHANAIDTTEFFVRQQYLDFLGREPDAPGFNGWVNTLRNCAPGDASCDRVHVSEMFFRSQEFQERGYFVYRFYSSALGRKPDYAEFTPDLGRVSGFLTNAQLEAAKVKFVDDFMARPAFAAQFSSLSNSAYVDALINTAQVNLANRQALVDGLDAGTLTRAQALRQIAESVDVYQKYYNQAFVVMEYFGYLRRDPDALYTNWIQVLDANPADSRHMVNGFVNSTEYRNRFAQ